MTERAEIERLLNETGFTLDGLPELYPLTQCEDAIRRSGFTVGMAGNMICHQSDVIERLVNALRSALDMRPKWISVKDRLPESTDVYLVNAVHRYNKNDGYRSMQVRLFFEDDDVNNWQGLPDLYEVTHWMPLPEPPKEG